jgi:hypothetical protein
VPRTWELKIGQPTRKGLNVNNRGSQPVDNALMDLTTLKGLNVKYKGIVLKLNPENPDSDYCEYSIKSAKVHCSGHLQERTKEGDL